MLKRILILIKSELSVLRICESTFEMIMIVVAFIRSLWRIIILWYRIFQKKPNWHSNDHCWCNTFAQDEEIGNTLGGWRWKNMAWVCGDLCPFDSRLLVWIVFFSRIYYLRFWKRSVGKEKYISKCICRGVQVATNC